MENIKIPVTVTREERAAIRETYLAGIGEADSEKVSYIIKNLPRVLKRLRRSDEVWHEQIANVAERFADLLHPESGVAKSGRKELVAALYYLCHPFEVIPDYVPGRGYADDALVLNMCLSRLRQRGANVDETDEQDLSPLQRMERPAE